MVGALCLGCAASGPVASRDRKGARAVAPAAMAVGVGGYS